MGQNETGTSEVKFRNSGWVVATGIEYISVSTYKSICFLTDLTVGPCAILCHLRQCIRVGIEQI